MAETEATESDEGESRLNRRNAIKAGVGLGGAALIWTEPTLKGLVRRPAYAQTASQCLNTPLNVNVTFTFTIENEGTTNVNVTNISASPSSICGYTLNMCSERAGNRPGLVVADAAGCTSNSPTGPVTFNPMGPVTGGLTVFQYNRSNAAPHRAVFDTPVSNTTYSITMGMIYNP